MWATYETCQPKLSGNGDVGYDVLACGMANIIVHRGVQDVGRVVRVQVGGWRPVTLRLSLPMGPPNRPRLVLPINQMPSNFMRIILAFIKARPFI